MAKMKIGVGMKLLKGWRGAWALGLASLLLGGAVQAQAQATTPAHFAVVGDHFELDGKPYVIRSGEMHYPRVPREFWRERMRQARAMGLNTITTYVFWNLHEAEPGRFDFSGNLDLAAFLRTAKEEGLNVILRPGPYICTELDFGGFPSWLLRTPGMKVRSLDPRYMAASGRYLQRVGREVAPFLSSRGGPILMVQVENEYGSFGNDKDYLNAVRRQYLDAGFTQLPLFTSDGPDPHLLADGTLPGLSSVINFNGNADEVRSAFDELAAFRPKAPRMAGEYWAGWFDHWGETHHRTSAAQEAGAVDWMLSQGISFNLYMFHGGTSFGWTAGANGGGTERLYQPDTTSYDYDAPLDEAGRPTAKYFALRDAIARHLPASEPLPPRAQAQSSTPTIAIAPFVLDESVALLDALPALAQAPVSAHLTRSMEALGQDHGLVLYRKRLAEAATGPLKIEELHDYAVVMADRRPLGTLDRRLKAPPLQVALAAGTTLDLLVEGLGRINFGRALVEDGKGITRSVAVGEQELLDWQMYPLPLDELSALRFSTPAQAPEAGPAFWRGHFELGARGNSFLDTRALGHGHVWVNGHHLGRYWRVGPQQTLFIPAPWLKQGRNEVLVLDLEGGFSKPSLQGLTEPVFETPAPPKPH
jgi:beta-galactosidase